MKEDESPQQYYHPPFFSDAHNNPMLEKQDWPTLKAKMLKSPFFQKVFFESKKELIKFLRKNSFKNFTHLRKHVEYYYTAKRNDALSTLENLFPSVDPLIEEEQPDGSLLIAVSPEADEWLQNKFCGVAKTHLDLVIIDPKSKKTLQHCYRNKPHALISKNEVPYLTSLLVVVDISPLAGWRLRYKIPVTIMTEKQEDVIDGILK